MHMLFVDESGRLDQGGLFALGGLAVRDTDWLTLRDLWQTTLRRADWPLDTEIKWHGIRTGAVPPAVGDAVFAMLSRGPLTCYVVVVDLDRGPVEFPLAEFEYFRSPDDVYATALMFLAERFQHLLAEREDVGMIIVDSRKQETDERLRRFFRELQKDGTPYMRLDRIVECLFLAPSHFSIGLQCADLVTATTVAAERGVGQGRGYLRSLMPRFAAHPASGEVAGVGLKRFPDQRDADPPMRRLF